MDNSDKMFFESDPDYHSFLNSLREGFLEDFEYLSEEELNEKFGHCQHGKGNS